MSAALGIDTSLYKTSCAIVGGDGRVLASVSRPLPVQVGALGLRQSDAVFLHVQQLPQALAVALDAVPAQDIRAVAASVRPAEAADSYMPVFEVGRAFGLSLARAWRVPFVETTHQRGHLRAGMIGVDGLPERLLAVHLSGGTSDVLLRDGQGRIALLSKGLDLHAGQLVDRVGVAMGYAFPAGAAIDRLAQAGRAGGRYGVSIREGGFHLSGAERAALADLSAGALSKEDIAANVLDVIARSLLRVLSDAAERTGVDDVLIFGGVAASRWLRDAMQDRIRRRGLCLRVRFGQPAYSGDNAAGVALIGLEQPPQPTERTVETHG